MLNYNSTIKKIYMDNTKNLTEEDKKKIENKLLANVRENFKISFIILYYN